MADKKISALTSASTPLAGTEVLPIVQSGSTVKVPVSDLTAGRDVAAQSMTVNQSGMTTPASFGQFPGSTSYGQVNFNGATTLGGLSGLIGGGSSGTMFLNAPTGGTINLLNGGAFVLQLGATDVAFSTGNLIQGTAAKGVNFTANTPAAGMTSQLLNWYEEGTFTPALVPGTSGSITLTSAAAKYTRIGRAVTVTGICEVSSVSSPVGALLLQGLPFTNSADASSRSAAAIYATGLAVTATTAIMGRIIPSESQIRIEKFAAGSTSAMAGDVQTNTIIQFNLTYFV